MCSNRTMKKKYLVCHDYGQGGLWAYVYAKSPQEINVKFRNLRVVTVSPAWLTLEEQAKLKVYDVDQPEGWLTSLAKEDE